MTGPAIESSEAESLLASVGADARGPKLLVALDASRVIWASAEAAGVFGSSDLRVLTKVIFGRPVQARPMAMRLARLAVGQALHLERVHATTRFRRQAVTLVCAAVPNSRVPIVLMRTLDAVEPETPPPIPFARDAAFVDGDEPSWPLPASNDADPHGVATAEPEGIVGGRGDGERVARLPLRFVWRSDRNGRITAVGGEMAAALGSAALRIGDDLLERLDGLDHEAAFLIGRAVAESRGWSGFIFRWPGGEGGAAAEVEIGGTPSAVEGGYRGFGLLRHLPQPVDEPAPQSVDNPQRLDEVRTDPLPVEPPEPRTIDADQDRPNAPSDQPPVADAETPAPDEAAREPAPDSLAPVNGAGSLDAESAGNVDGTAPDREAEPVPVRSGRFGAQVFSASGTSKVIHLATFKAGVAPMSGKATSRREPVPEAVETGPLDAPLWAEAPRESNPADGRLSNHERFNFDEIARALAALPVGEAVGVARLSEAESAAQVEGPDHGRPAEPGDVEALLESLPLGILVSQADTAVYANRALLDLANCDSLAEFESIGGLARVLRGIRGAPPSGSHSYELMGHKDRRVAVDGRVQKIVWRTAPATLITLRRSDEGGGAAGAAAHDSEIRGLRTAVGDLRAAVDLAASGAGFLDVAGRILSISSGAERLFGFSPRDMAGEDCAALVAIEHKDAWRAFYSGFTSGAAEGRSSAYRRFSFRKRGGGSVLVGVSLRVLEADKICIVWQEEQSGRADAGDLDARRVAAERSSNLKSEFLAKVSHEIRTPLNAILGFAEIIIEERFGPVANDRYREYLKDIHASGTHVVSLVNDLLDLSRIEAGGLSLNPVPVNVNVVLGECVATIQGQAHRDRVIVRSSFAAQSAFALVDERALRQIVLNLLSNAVKFNEHGGQVIVSSAMSEGGQIVVRVRDTGPGMSESEIETAMKPFRQLATPKAGAGTGLGLPLTKAMVEASHGSFRIQSKPGEGTLVEVMLQRAPDRPVSLQAE